MYKLFERKPIFFLTTKIIVKAVNINNPNHPALECGTFLIAFVNEQPSPAYRTNIKKYIYS